MSAIEQYFGKLLERINGLKGICLADRDGVDIIKITSDDHASVLLNRPNLSTIFVKTSDQASKLGLSKNKTIVTYFDNIQLVQLRLSATLILTLIAANEANTGLLLDVYDEVLPLVTDIEEALAISTQL